MTYIYGLVDPRDESIRYVGKCGDLGRRLGQHLQSRARDAHTAKGAWINELVDAGKQPEITVLEKLAPEADWEVRERFWIAQLTVLGAPLTNATAGGIGGRVPAATSPEANAKRSASLRALRGSYMTPQVRAKIGAANLGKIRTAETREKIRTVRASQVMPTMDATNRQRMSELMKLRVRTPEEIAKAKANRPPSDGKPKLTPGDVLAIRRRAAEGEVQAQLAREYSVSQASITNIVRRKVWRHI